MTLRETPLAEKQTIDERKQVVTNHTVTIPPYHISIIPFKPVNHTFGINLQTNTLLEIKRIPILSLLNNFTQNP